VIFWIVVALSFVWLFVETRCLSVRLAYGLPYYFTGDVALMRVFGRMVDPSQGFIEARHLFGL